MNNILNLSDPVNQRMAASMLIWLTMREGGVLILPLEDLAPIWTNIEKYGFHYIMDDTRSEISLKVNNEQG
jgi:hypothetical protein